MSVMDTLIKAMKFNDDDDYDDEEESKTRITLEKKALPHSRSLQDLPAALRANL